MQLTDFASAPNLVRLFFTRADELGQRPFLTAKIEGAWTSISWTEAARQVCLLAESLRSMGLKDGDRVVLVAENRPEWAIADLAIMAAGCITTPAYTTNTERDHLHILDNSGAKAVIVSSRKLAEPLLPAIVRSGIARQVIAMEPLRAGQADFEVHQWGDLIEGDGAAARAAVEARIAGIGRRDPACIIYTSGTSGAPRGVLLHHGAILCNVEGAAEVLAGDFGWGEERFLSFLPLSHALEHTAGLFLPIGLGADIWFAEGLDKLGSNIEEAKPTFMVVVPRLFEMLRGRIVKQVEKQGRFAQFLLDQALNLAERRAAGMRRLSDWPVERLLDATLRPKIRQRFGGRIKALVSGGAPLNPEVGAFFESMGLVMLQGYGQTESAPVVSCNYPSAGIRLATVGPPLRGVEVRIAEDGEILVRGELVMLGYWHNPAETAKTIIDGWLHTGDIGHLDDGGRIVITDRKKDIIVNDKGDNIAPQKLEGMLTLQPEISQAMVNGDKRPYVVGLVVPDCDWSFRWAKENGEKLDIDRLQQLPAFRSAVRTAIDRVNHDLSVTEKVRQFTFADEPFTIENGEMTPSLKIRRHKIRERYGDRIDGLYKG
ncbi:long-chain fatty acid--CoA ligase [Croceibacterium sp. LX-88]|uniref:Long-chain fatty acid--CoA ligase n=1 Tax=Croceibacterium selenioxidans TaxID=2838833 RepID=A0ABS5W6D2_9SPHN|nr:long-chain fatty acid--CoA ligase [Croceibacterium selenioxidans]MBT2135305.1 long-chain fatty acid--CoA ligase [Croceibacterium selenioxidans]